MKSKFLLSLLLFVILTLQFGCGGGGGDSSGDSATTRVEITIGRTQTASQDSGTLLKETDQIPSSVAQIRITITGSDMQTISRIIPAAERTVITESFEVPVGSGRRFLVEALDSAGFVIFQGETLANVGGTPIALTISMVNTDPVTPIFAGLSTASYTNSFLTLNWQPAADNVTAHARMQYLIFTSTTPGGHNFSAIPYDVVTGTTTYTKTEPSIYGPQYFVVRAKDEYGNTDLNTQERSVNVDAVAPVFGGLSTAAYGNTILTLTWYPATDNITAQPRIQYLIFQSTTAGGENFAGIPYDIVTGTTSYTKTGVNFSGPQYFVVRARDENGNTDSNTEERLVNSFIELSVSDAVDISEGIETYTLSYTVRNTGTLDATGVTVYAMYGDTEFGETYNTTCAPSDTFTVPAGGSETISISTWFLPNTYKIFVDPTNAIAEQTETNNTTCAGDLCSATVPEFCGES